MAIPIYTQRRHAFEGERTYSFEDGALVRRENGRPVRSLPLGQVSRVRLAYEPTRVQAGLWTCCVWGGCDKAFWAAFSSTHYLGINDFEDRGRSYGTFVRALNDAVMRANPDAVFDTGPGLAMFMVNAAALAIGLFMFGSLLIVIGFDEVSHWAWCSGWLKQESRSVLKTALKLLWPFGICSCRTV